uniref:Uncharacterized protein n=1 Tax=Rhipicephalus microplus TaxID=6941 RepID=A0A6G5AG82_RHIMP
MHRLGGLSAGDNASTSFVVCASAYCMSPNTTRLNIQTYVSHRIGPFSYTSSLPDLGPCSPSTEAANGSRKLLTQRLKALKNGHLFTMPHFTAHCTICQYCDNSVPR